MRANQKLTSWKIQNWMDGIIGIIEVPPNPADMIHPNLMAIKLFIVLNPRERRPVRTPSSELRMSKGKNIYEIIG